MTIKLVAEFAVILGALLLGARVGEGASDVGPSLMNLIPVASEWPSTVMVMPAMFAQFPVAPGSGTICRSSMARVDGFQDGSRAANPESVAIMYALSGAA